MSVVPKGLWVLVRVLAWWSWSRRPVGWITRTPEMGFPVESMTSMVFVSHGRGTPTCTEAEENGRCHVDTSIRLSGSIRDVAEHAAG